MNDDMCFGCNGSGSVRNGTSISDPWERCPECRGTGRARRTGRKSMEQPAETIHQEPEESDRERA